tara:strand:- start:21862 stop:22467 length:606 start_codon:yes stop_codon:yes gene_type:complete
VCVGFSSVAIADQAAVTALNQAGITLTEEEYFEFLQAEPAQIGAVTAELLAKRSTVDSELVANVVGTLVAEFPDYAVAITESVVRAFPSMAPVIVAAAIKAAPLQVVEIVAAAVAAAPNYARAIVAAAVAAYPQLAGQIVQTAIKAAPEQRTAINSGARDGLNKRGGSDQTASGPSKTTPGKNKTKGGGSGGDTNGAASPG